MSEEQMNLLSINTCRICLEDEPNMNTLIKPCKCSGSSNFVHVSCLQEWIRLSDNPEAKEKCMECKTMYNFSRNHTLIDIFVNVNNYKQYLFKHMALCFSFTIVVNLFDFTQNEKIIGFLFINDENLSFFTDYDVLNFMIYLSLTSYLNNIVFVINYFYRVHKKTTEPMFYIYRDIEMLGFQAIYQIFFPVVLCMFIFMKEYFGFFMTVFSNIFLQPNGKMVFIKLHKKHIIEYNNSNENIEILPYEIEQMEIEISD